VKKFCREVAEKIVSEISGDRIIGVIKPAGHGGTFQKGGREPFKGKKKNLGHESQKATVASFYWRMGEGGVRRGEKRSIEGMSHRKSNPKRRITKLETL